MMTLIPFWNAWSVWLSIECSITPWESGSVLLSKAANEFNPHVLFKVNYLFMCAVCVCLTILTPFNRIPSTHSLQTFSFSSYLTLMWFQSPNLLPMFSPELFFNSKSIMASPVFKFYHNYCCAVLIFSKICEHNWFNKFLFIFFCEPYFTNLI